MKIWEKCYCKFYFLLNVFYTAFSGKKSFWPYRGYSEQIRIFPYSGIAVPDKKLAKNGFRMRMIVVENYLMFYMVFEDEAEVVIYRIFNGKMNYPALMRSLYDNAE